MCEVYVSTVYTGRDYVQWAYAANILAPHPYTVNYSAFNTCTQHYLQAGDIQWWVLLPFTTALLHFKQVIYI